MHPVNGIERWVTPISTSTWTDNVKVPIVLPAGFKLYRFANNNMGVLFSICLEENVSVPNVLQGIEVGLEQWA